MLGKKTQIVFLSHVKKIKSIRLQNQVSRKKSVILFGCRDKIVFFPLSRKLEHFFLLLFEIFPARTTPELGLQIKNATDDFLKLANYVWPNTQYIKIRAKNVKPEQMHLGIVVHLRLREQNPTASRNPRKSMADLWEYTFSRPCL